MSVTLLTHIYAPNEILSPTLNPLRIPSLNLCPNETSYNNGTKPYIYLLPPYSGGEDMTSLNTSLPYPRA